MNYAVRMYQKVGFEVVEHDQRARCIDAEPTDL